MSLKMIHQIFGKVPEKQTGVVQAMLTSTTLLCSFAVIFAKTPLFQIAAAFPAFVALFVWSRLSRAAAVIQGLFAASALLCLALLFHLLAKGA
jgi:hypothetical protein